MRRRPKHVAVVALAIALLGGCHILLPYEVLKADAAGDGAGGDLAPDQGYEGSITDVRILPDAAPWTLWVTVPKGGFFMGSPGPLPKEKCRDDNEDLHQVTLTRAFVIQRTEVTQAQFQQQMGHNPSTHKGCPSCPVENLTWSEAVSYCNVLSEEEGYDKCYQCTSTQRQNDSCKAKQGYTGDLIYNCPGYRLPTDAEWERAYRAGTQTALYNGPLDECGGHDPNADKIAWYSYNAGGKTHVVAGKDANAWEIHDMAGNVAELIHDWYQWHLGYVPVTDPVNTKDNGINGRVVRGGYFGRDAYALRAADREWFWVNDQNAGVGFRCVRGLH